MSKLAKSLWAMVLLGACMLVAALAFGQPASAPASLPAIPVDSGWLASHWEWVAAIVGWILCNVITLLSEYPAAQDATTPLAKTIRVLRLLAALLAVVHFKNTGGVGLAFKAPGPITAAKVNPPAKG